MLEPGWKQFWRLSSNYPDYSGLYDIFQVAESVPVQFRPQPPFFEE